jgi:hypothetical protein
MSKRILVVEDQPDSVAKATLRNGGDYFAV